MVALVRWWCISILRGSRENYICSARRRERLRAGVFGKRHGLDAPDPIDRADKSALADSIIQIDVPANLPAAINSLLIECRTAEGTQRGGGEKVVSLQLSVSFIVVQIERAVAENAIENLR